MAAASPLPPSLFLRNLPCVGIRDWPAPGAVAVFVGFVFFSTIRSRMPQGLFVSSFCLHFALFVCFFLHCAIPQFSPPIFPLPQDTTSKKRGTERHWLHKILISGLNDGVWTALVRGCLHVFFCMLFNRSIYFNSIQQFIIFPSREPRSLSAPGPHPAPQTAPG